MDNKQKTVKNQQAQQMPELTAEQYEEIKKAKEAYERIVNRGKDAINAVERINQEKMTAIEFTAAMNDLLTLGLHHVEQFKKISDEYEKRNSGNLQVIR